MDDIERLYRHLVRLVRANHAPLLTQPIEVGELYQTIVPYRLHRRALGFETNQDYELAMLELLSGARGYLVVDDRMRDALAAAQSARHPDPSIVREFASAHVALAPEPLRQLDVEGRVPASQSLGAPLVAPVSPTPPPARRSGSTGGVETPPPARSGAPTPAASLSADVAATRRPSRPVTIAKEGDSCSFCRGELPAGRQVGFCPHCGQDLTVVHCPACGSELERGWKFCVTCGRSSVEQ